MLLPRLTKRSLALPALCLLVWAFLIRLPVLGHPALYIDESWYLYVGGQLLDGHLPYVDVWDRKPFGLFLLYAPFYLFGEHRFLAYQLAALLFAWGTALFILRISKKFLSFSSGFCAAAFYLVLLNDLGGCGGQTPVFYNFLTAFAFFLVLSRFEEIKINPLSLTVTGLQEMFLLGLAIEIKPTAGFEGIYLGCFLLYRCWQSQKNLKSMLKNGISWIFMALLPTFCVMGFYLKIGHFQDWYFANMVSVFLRHTDTDPYQLFRMIGVLAAALSVWSVTFILNWRNLLLKEKAYFLFLSFWLGISAVAIAILPPYNPIYILPFALPFALFTAFLSLNSTILGKLALAGLFLIACVDNVRCFSRLLPAHPRAEYAHLQEIARQHPGCLFQYGGTVTMLDLTPEMAKNCHLTKYAFPGHLDLPNEENAIGLPDSSLELKAILAKKPEMILVGRDYFDPPSEAPFLLKENRMMQQALTKDYSLFYERTEKEAFQLYLLNETS